MGGDEPRYVGEAAGVGGFCLMLAQFFALVTHFFDILTHLKLSCNFLTFFSRFFFEFWRFWGGLGMDFGKFFRGFVVIISTNAILRKLAFRLDGSMIFKVSSF